MPKARQQLLTPPRACSGNALSSERCWLLATASHRWWDQWTQSYGLKSCFQFKWRWEVHILVSFIKPSELPLWANQGGKWPKQSTKTLLTIMSVQNLHCIKNLGQGCCLGMVAAFYRGSWHVLQMVSGLALLNSWLRKRPTIPLRLWPGLNSMGSQYRYSSQSKQSKTKNQTMNE